MSLLLNDNDAKIVRRALIEYAYSGEATEERLQALRIAGAIDVAYAGLVEGVNISSANYARESQKEEGRE